MIRKARKEDALQIAEVHVRSWQQTYKGIISQEFLDQIKVENRLSLWKNILSTPSEDSLVYVAENSEGQVVGFASFGIERINNQKTEAELYAIYIIDEYKRGKIGTRLLLFGVEELVNQGFKSLLVWVLAKNPGRKFYESVHPIQVSSENLQIGKYFYEEVAYKWTDLELLIKEIKK
ncbi:MAG: GNAT family N-acetyltransferase [Bacillota bacterium]|nr:GNAT family N-acetyltransferase [Bacillota bacterium]